MPHCENTACNKKITPDEACKEIDGSVVCPACADGVTPLHGEPKPQQMWGRDFNYDFGYTRQRGAYAGVSLGGAKMSLEISQEELTRTFGPAK